MMEAYFAASAGFIPSLDLLIIDEAQDFDASWVETQCIRLKPGGRLCMLEDEAQRLYQHAGFDVEDAVTIRCIDNFRSPRVICDVINALSLVRPSIRGLNPRMCEVPGTRSYGSDEELLAATEGAVTALLARGFALADIANVCGRGRERSVLLNQVSIGPWRTRRFTAEYAAMGSRAGATATY
jgi:hypothetical protein